MELASRILSVLLGAAVMVFVLWPVTIPVGFGEVWWASRQAQAPVKTERTVASTPKPESNPAAAIAPSPAQHAALPSPAEPKQKEAAGAGERAAFEPPDKTGTVAPQASAPRQATKTYRRVTVRDGGTLQADGVIIRLSGIAAREAEANCRDARGKTWRCGATAKAALSKLIRGRAVTCALPKSGEHNIIVARCSVGGTDLSAWMLRQGWAEPRDTNEAPLIEAAQAAKQERLGFWRDGD